MSLASRISNLFRRSRLDREIDDELRAHIEMRTEDNIRAGMSPKEARRDALLRFGNRLAMKEHVTTEDTELWLAALGRDTRLAVRRLCRSPGFALTVIVTLALGIGANVIVLGVVNALVLKPLDVPHPAGLYNVVHKDAGDDNQSYPDYLDYKERSHTFTDMAVYRYTEGSLLSNGHAEKVWINEISGNFFSLLGVKPALGRMFAASDEHGPNSAPYVVLSYGYWRSRFHGDLSVVGKAVEINKHPFTIVGVAPAGFHGAEMALWPDVWVPIVNEQQVEEFDFLTNRQSHGSWILGKLRPGITVVEAEADLNNAAREMARLYPHTDTNLSARLVKPGLFGDSIGDPARSFLAGILVLSLLVLLAACANLASIFGARVADRSHELAIRLAIGAGRWRILKELLIEAVLISLAGGVLGTAVAGLLLRGLTQWRPVPNLPIHVTVSANTLVYVVALAMSLASGLFFGLLPARQVWRTSASQVIKGPAANRLVRRFSLRDLLLGVQIAICTLLVTTCFVALRGMQHSMHAPLGFDPQNITLLRTDMHMAGYTGKNALPLQKALVARVAALPGVEAAGLANTVPLSPVGNSNAQFFPEYTTDFEHPRLMLVARYYSVGPGYLDAARTRLIAGRNVSWEDTGALPVALVNETFARRFFGGAQQAIGRRFLFGRHYPLTVAGVVEDGKYDSLAEDPESAVFLPLSQSPDAMTVVLVRSTLPTSSLAPALRHAAVSIDPGLPLEILPWRADLALVFFPAYIAAAALGIMGLLAAMLAITGTFGMAAYSVSKRMRELGIRVALGAQRVQLMRSALGRPLVLLISGSIAGLVLGVLVSRLLAQIVYQATPRDPLVLAGVVATMALIGLAATWIPARHALSIDPARLLREE